MLADTAQFIQAAHYKPHPGPRSIRVIVIHTAECGQQPGAARGVARYFQGTDRPASAHYVVDPGEIVHCVQDHDIAYAAPPCNADGLHIEHAGTAETTDWTTAISLAELHLSARLVAERAHVHGVPVVHLDGAALKAGKSGIVGHATINQVYHESTHSDPGVKWPWEAYMAMVEAAYRALTG